MAVEKITTEQKEQTKNVEDECSEAKRQAELQEISRQIKEAEKLVKQELQKMAEIPTQMLDQLEAAKDKLCNIVSGYTNPDSIDFDPDKELAELDAMLKPVVEGLTALPIPTIPGLAQITELMAALKKMTAKGTNLSDEELQKRVPKKSSLPSKFLTILSELGSAIKSIISAIPMVLFNLVFQMFNIIIGLFKQIAGIIGVPSIPFPLNLAPKCIELSPKLFDFSLRAEEKISSAAKGIIKQKLREIQALQIPELPDEIKIPESKSVCPEHDTPADDKDKDKDKDKSTTDKTENAK